MLPIFSRERFLLCEAGVFQKGDLSQTAASRHEYCHEVPDANKLLQGEQCPFASPGTRSSDLEELLRCIGEFPIQFFEP